MHHGGLRRAQGLMQHTQESEAGRAPHHPVLRGQAFSTSRHIGLSICVLTLTEYQVFVKCDASSRGELQDNYSWVSLCKSIISFLFCFRSRIHFESIWGEEFKVCI